MKRLALIIPKGKKVSKYSWLWPAFSNTLKFQTMFNESLLYGKLHEVPKSNVLFGLSFGFWTGISMCITWKHQPGTKKITLMAELKEKGETWSYYLGEYDLRVNYTFEIAMREGLMQFIVDKPSKLVEGRDEGKITIQVPHQHSLPWLQWYNYPTFECLNAGAPQDMTFQFYYE